MGQNAEVVSHARIVDALRPDPPHQEGMDDRHDREQQEQCQTEHSHPIPPVDQPGFLAALAEQLPGHPQPGFAIHALQGRRGGHNSPLRAALATRSRGSSEIWMRSNPSRVRSEKIPIATIIPATSGTFCSPNANSKVVPTPDQPTVCSIMTIPVNR